MDRLGPLADAVRAATVELAERNAVARLWDGDHTLWGDDPTEVADRLGWLRVAGEVAAQRERLDGLRMDCQADGLRHAVVLGMGGSSLFPEVIARSFETADGLHLRVLDTTDPVAVRRIEHECPLEQTLFVASSKSGTTIETRSQLDHFWSLVPRGEHFVVVTDPGSELAHLADERGFRQVFENRPDIGGRYSALSYFGMVPAALAGAPWSELLTGAERVSPSLDAATDPAHNPAVLLAAAMAAGVRTGRDKLTLVVDQEVETFELWLEQLLAESTGKHGTGVIPVAGERLGPPEVYGDDRLFVAIGEHHGLDRLAAAGHPVVDLPFHSPDDLGAQALVWEVATALAGALLGINPFDQPNVAEAKAATAEVLERGLPDIEEEPLDQLLAKVGPGDYVAIQAYVDPESGLVDGIEDSRTAIRDRFRVATTVGLGPRFLHSTGQLHKGGPPTGVFVQVVGVDPEDVEVPGAPFTFSQLKQAQAAGDLATLRHHGLRAGRVALADLLEAAR